MKGLALSRRETKENRAVLYDSERRLQGDGVVYHPHWRIPSKFFPLDSTLDPLIASKKHICIPS